jgi:putative ABC transport system permease protein
MIALLAGRLAWRQLVSSRARLVSAIAGVMFACVLVFMQLGFRAALFDSASNLPRALQGELFLVNPLTLVMFRPEPIARVRASQTLADPDVALAVPIYLAQTKFRNPDTGRQRTIQLIGFDPEAGAVDFAGLAPLVPALKRIDTIGFDRRSRPEFGNIAGRLEREGPFEVEVGGRAVLIAGLVELGTSFGADGNAVMTETNFRRIVKERQASKTDLVAIRLKPGADAQAVKSRLAAILPADVVVLTGAELIAWERAYWEQGTPIGFIFGFGSLMGLVVGMVIVYQILFSDIATHLREYATLKAIGYSNHYLRLVVMGAALMLAVLGFVPGFLGSIGLYGVVAKATLLPLGMEAGRAVAVFGLIFAMCALAGLLAMRKLGEADPADMF